MTAMSLRVVPPAAACRGCSRRFVLRGFAMTAATVLVGCPGSEPPPPDGPSAMPTMCGDNLCLDLTDPLNAALTRVDGTLPVRASKDTILVVRTSTTAVQAVSDVCTHAGCAVVYDHVNKVLNCPCHGSRFSLAGSVLRGPAASPLKKYVTQFDQGMNLLTIML
jgi:cytochrome b6-f complex iron-sulfur subunit